MTTHTICDKIIRSHIRYVDGSELINRVYKDKLFTFLFGREENKEYLLSLYNAINNTDYTDVDEIEITTIEDVIYLGYKNDISLILTADETMQLYEHQTSFNPNMPLRGLFYFSKLYQKYVTGHKLNIYGTKRLRIPTPQYYVFYLGSPNEPAITEFTLSEMFAGESDALECKAKMININNNPELLEKCRILAEYNIFINEVYTNISKFDTMESAIDAAIQNCINNHVLEGFLEAHRAEVKDMILTEFNEEEYIQMLKDESKAEGRAEGEENGKIKTIIELISDDLLSLEKGAEKLGISVNELEKLMEKYK